MIGVKSFYLWTQGQRVNSAQDISHARYRCTDVQAPHVRAINAHMVHQHKAKRAISVPGTVQPEVKALTPFVMKEVSERRSSSSNRALQNLQVTQSSEVYDSSTV